MPSIASAELQQTAWCGGHIPLRQDRQDYTCKPWPQAKTESYSTATRQLRTPGPIRASHHCDQEGEQPSGGTEPLPSPRCRRQPGAEPGECTLYLTLQAVQARQLRGQGSRQLGEGRHGGRGGWHALWDGCQQLGDGLRAGVDQIRVGGRESGYEHFQQPRDGGGFFELDAGSASPLLNAPEAGGGPLEGNALAERGDHSCAGEPPWS